VAGETRRQRRDARRAAGAGEPALDAGRGGGGGRSGAPLGGGVPQPSGGGHTPAAEGGTHRRGGFVRESWAELQKVEWPNRQQVIQGTVVVIIACAIVGAYLWGVDQALRPFVRDVLIG
jgi:preprotein translocase subunit SecE